MPLKLNTLAPDFSLPSTSGRDFSLSTDQKGKPCILYFYPKDFTPGCTKEACEFRDSFHFFKDLNIDIYGISKDDMVSHLKFKKAHNLPFELLSDLKGKVAKKYQAQLPILKLTKRITYLLNANHQISAVYEDLFGAKKHIQEMIQKVKN
ncbi:peroxiredoxin [Xanthovirga aplysinae]|uniref:peroxiredoxin n=1 Tax=Xanthovirga aplysinae TaxID=2529853 RepID=UPI0012BC3DEB|nr:peroxiredoxin [Xanthovirga aplysinae]MTI29468.1 peroxiredoxin [Xanthovirga aplysinae]